MVKEGYWYGLPLVLLAGGLAGVQRYAWSAAVIVIAGLVLNFFRDPEREIPSDSRFLVSPADGRTQQVVAEEFGGRRWQRVSIFMSPLDVHVNRSPVDGNISDVEYRRGSFHPAMRPESSLENEQNIVTIRGDDTVVVVRQIAGLIARRIVFWKKRGESLRKGERFGLIKFGSRVDVLMEPQVEILVQPGDRVRAGSSILAIIK